MEFNYQWLYDELTRYEKMFKASKNVTERSAIMYAVKKNFEECVECTDKMGARFMEIAVQKIKEGDQL